MKFKIINSIMQMLPFCNIHIGQYYYQDRFRFYMDEFPEQEELRKKWFEDNKCFLHKNRFGQFSMMFEGGTISEFTDACKKMAKLGFEVINKTDTYFITRWMIRQ